MGDNVFIFMRMAAEQEADELRLALHKIIRLAPEEKVIPLDQAFATVREMVEIARKALAAY